MRPLPAHAAAIALVAALGGCTPAPAGTVAPPITFMPGAGFDNMAAPGAPAATAGAGATAGATAGTGATATAGATLATGTGGSLTRDNAEAFVDAFQFALGEVGRGKTFSAAEREQLVQQLAKDFAKQPEASQRALVDARATWTRTRDGWATTDAATRQSFVQDVLVIGLGDQAAAQLTGQGGAAAGTGTTASGGGDPWAAEAKEKCENGSYEDQMFYCHGVITPSAPSW